MKWDWEKAALFALGAGAAYAVYRAEHEAKAPTLLTIQAATPTAPSAIALAPKPAFLGTLSPTQATGTAMVGGMALYALADFTWDIVKDRLRKATNL